MVAFAALEARVNTAVRRRLTNRAVLVGAIGFDATFDDAGEAMLDGLVEATEPRLSAVPAEVAAALNRDDPVTVTNPVTAEVLIFELVRKVPDGAGFFTLFLRKP